MSSRKFAGSVRPGGGLVVAVRVFQAAVQDANEPVDQAPERVVVVDATGAEVVRVGAGAWRSVQRGEGWVVSASMIRSLWMYRAAMTLFLPRGKALAC